METQLERDPSARRMQTLILKRIRDTWPPDCYGEDLDGLIRDCLTQVKLEGVADVPAEIQRIVDDRHLLERDPLRRQIKSGEFMRWLDRMAYAAAARWPRLVNKYGRKPLAEDVTQDVRTVLLTKLRDGEPIRNLPAFAYACVRHRLSTMNRDLPTEDADLDGVLESTEAPRDPSASPEQRVTEAQVPTTLFDLARTEIDLLEEVCVEYPKRKSCYTPNDRQRALMKEAFRRAVYHSWSGNKVWKSFNEEETSGVVTRTQFFEMFRLVADNILAAWKQTWRAK